MKWVRSDSVIAQRLSNHEVRGFFLKKIHIGEHEHAFIEKDGNIIEEAENRNCKIGGLLGKGQVNVILFDKSEKRMQRPVVDLWTNDKNMIHATVVIKLQITGFNSFMGHFMRTRNAVLLEDLWSDIKEELVSKVIGPVVSKRSLIGLSDIPDVQKTIESEAFRKMGDSLRSIGITLLSLVFNPAFSYENQQEIEKVGSEMQKADADAIISRKLKKAEEVSSRELDREAAISEMENERIRRETEIQLEREETQTDIEEALEALELKSIKNKQKLIKEISNLKSNIKPDEKDTEATIKNLQFDIEKLRMARDMAEKKFYKNEITEENFKKLADDYERKIIELKMKIEGLKKAN